MQSRFAVLSLLLVGVVGSGAIACGGASGVLSNNGSLGASNASQITTVELKNCNPSTRPVISEGPFLAEAKDNNGSILSVPITFQSTRPDIASISGGLLKTYYPGQTTITASSGGVTSAPCNLAVLPPSNTQTVLQLTDNQEDDSWGQNNNGSTLSRGKVLWRHFTPNGDADVMMGDVSGNVAPLKTVAGGDVDFMLLGSGASPHKTLAAWRENLSNTFVSDDGASPSPLGAQLQEENSIADGCFFFRRGQPDNDILRYNPMGLKTVSQNGDLFNPVTSQCKAVYELQQNGMSTLIYFDGANETPVAIGLPLFPRFDFREGKIVYAQGGDIFLYDATAANPQAVNLTNDPNGANNFPKTDGHSVVFTRNHNNFYDVVLYDIATGTLKVVSTTSGPKNGNSLRLDLSQAIWMEGSDLFFYDGNATAPVNPFPATGVEEAYLSEGVVAWHGPTGPATDHEIFILK
ncbi:MAG: hypothetical protein U1F57_09545 [bacterium]